MSAFTGPLTLTQLDPDWRLWELETPLIYEVGDVGSGRVIEVPGAVGEQRGFITDGASVPRLFWAVLPAWGKYSRAAVVHDYLGDRLVNQRDPHPEGQTQAAIDRIFLEAMTVLGVAAPVRFLLYAIVRAVAIIRRLP